MNLQRMLIAANDKQWIGPMHYMWTWRYGLDLITGKGIWGLFTLSIKGVTRLKFKRRQPPLPSFPSPPSSSSLFLPLPFLPLLYPLEGLGPVKRCELPQWGLGRSPSRWLIWCLFEPKRMALADDNTVMDFESKYLQLSGVSECPWQLSSLQKKKRRQLPPRASH